MPVNGALNLLLASRALMGNYIYPFQVNIPL